MIAISWPAYEEVFTMRVLITGNLGYIGTVLTAVLASKGHDVDGLDIGFFRECLLEQASSPNQQLIGDVREVTPQELEPYEAIVHLAGLSNDPLGELRPGLTESINRDATIRLAELAKSVGVRRFVYASSQSMYGIASTSSEIEEDDSEKHPLTSYARTKWEAELAIRPMADSDFVVSCFRPSTVFGASPRLRCDIVFNNLVACAYTTGSIEIKSDGTPWRPVVHIRDVCNAFETGLIAPESLINGRAFNVGIRDGNFSVRELALAAQEAVPGSKLVFTREFGPDERTYRVSFQRILHDLRDFYKPEWDLRRGAAELVSMFRRVGLTEADFRGPRTNRIKKIQSDWTQVLQDDTIRGKHA